MVPKDENNEVSIPAPSTTGAVETYVPMNAPPSIDLTPKRSFGAMLVWTAIIVSIVFVWMKYQNESSLRQAEQEQHQNELDQLQGLHESQLKAREEVFDARIQQEHEKGFVADYVQPWIDWFRGAEVEVELGADVKGVGGTLKGKVKPGS